MWERLRAGELYRAEDPEVLAGLTRAQGLAHRVNQHDPTDAAGLRVLLEELLGAFGDGSEIRPPLHVDYGVHTRFGARCFANVGLVALDVAPISIGDHVQIGPNVQLLTPTHPVAPGPRRAGWESAEPIRIGAGVWLGGGD